MEQKRETEVMAIEVKELEYYSKREEAKSLTKFDSPRGEFEILESFRTEQGMQYFKNTISFFKVMKFSIVK